MMISAHNQQPEERLTPTAEWIAITQIPRPFRVLDFPRKDPVTGKPVAEVAVVVLTQEEQMVCSAAAEKFARQIMKEAPKSDEARRGYDDLYNNAAAVEILFRACKCKDDVKKPFFPSPSEIRRVLSVDEVGALMMHYLTVQSEIGPIVARMTSEEVEAWISRLGEGGSAIPLDLLSWDALKTLAFSLACRLHNSSTDTSSPGSPPDEAS